MRAVGLRPGVSDSLALLERPRPSAGSGEVLVRSLEVGVDGTDRALQRGQTGSAPAGEQTLVIGHESLGRVVELGPGARGLAEGELVTAMVRRPCPERCPPCRAGRVDLCATGNYVERGILGAHGFASEYYVERPEWLVRVPEDLKAVAVATEPMSVAVKGIERAFSFQREFPWAPRRALVTGAGSLGLLASLLLRLKGLDVVSYDRSPADGPKADIVRAMGGRYARATGSTMTEALKGESGFDLIFEATGDASLIFQAISLLRFNGVLCIAGIPEGRKCISVPGDCIGLEMVLENRIVFGMVSSSRAHFEEALRAQRAIEERWPGLLARILRGRFPLDRFKEAFAKPAVKNLIQFEGDVDA